MFQSTFRISDRALNGLLLFISMFLSLLSEHYGLDTLKGFIAEMPNSIKAAKKYFPNKKDVKQYMCCPKCFSLYDRTLYLPNQSTHEIKCSHIQFPNHTQRQHRQPCNTALTRITKTPSQSVLS